MRAIQAFYTYAKSRELDIDEAILACHFEAILGLLDGYALWLQSGRQSDNLVARIGTTAMASFPQIDPQADVDSAGTYVEVGQKLGSVRNPEKPNRRPLEAEIQ